MKSREIRYLIMLAVLLLLIGLGAVYLVNLQQSADRATASERATIDASNHTLDLTATP